MGGDTVGGDPLRRFEAEHDEALHVLERLEIAARALEAGQPPEPHLRAVQEAHAFLSTAVRAHNDNEELALFSILGAEAPTEVFVEEHHTLRALELELAEACAASDPAGRVPPVALELVDLLRVHIARENEVLFPMARSLLGEEGLARVAARLQA